MLVLSRRGFAEVKVGLWAVTFVPRQPVLSMTALN
jgi:hypothetical protein